MEILRRLHEVNWGSVVHPGAIPPAGRSKGELDLQSSVESGDLEQVGDHRRGRPNGERSSEWEEPSSGSREYAQPRGADKFGALKVALDAPMPLIDKRREVRGQPGGGEEIDLSLDRENDSMRRRMSTRLDDIGSVGLGQHKLLGCGSTERDREERTKGHRWHLQHTGALAVKGTPMLPSCDAVQGLASGPDNLTRCQDRAILIPELERPPTVQELGELSTSLSETARLLFAAGGFTATLQAVVDLSVETIEGCDIAGIFLVEGSLIETPTMTDAMVTAVDDAQRRFGEGPCLDVLVDGGTVYADDLDDDERWPQFGPAASALGIRSALAVELSKHGTHGALNLYARYPKAFSALDRARGLLLASMAGLALDAVLSTEHEQRRFGHLEGALVTRELIGQAEGILMERERITAQQAFSILLRASQHLNVKLRDVAQNVVDTGERPDTGPRP